MLHNIFFGSSSSDNNESVSEIIVIKISGIVFSVFNSFKEKEGLYSPPAADASKSGTRLYIGDLEGVGLDVVNLGLVFFLTVTLSVVIFFISSINNSGRFVIRFGLDDIIDGSSVIDSNDFNDFNDADDTCPDDTCTGDTCPDDSSGRPIT